MIVPAFGRMLSKTFRLAGLCFSRSPKDIALSMIASTRCRILAAVSVLVFHIGVKHFTTSATVISATGISPKVGIMYLFSVLIHCDSLLPSAFHPSRLVSIVLSAHSLNVIRERADSLMISMAFVSAATLSALLIGSIP